MFFCSLPLTALTFLVCLDPPSQCTEGCCAGTVHLWFWLHFPQAVVSGLVLAWAPLTLSTGERYGSGGARGLRRTPLPRSHSCLSLTYPEAGTYPQGTPVPHTKGCSGTALAEALTLLWVPFEPHSYYIAWTSHSQSPNLDSKPRLGSLPGNQPHLQIT